MFVYFKRFDRGHGQVKIFADLITFKEQIYRKSGININLTHIVSSGKIMLSGNILTQEAVV